MRRHKQKVQVTIAVTYPSSGDAFSATQSFPIGDQKALEQFLRQLTGLILGSKNAL